MKVIITGASGTLGEEIAGRFEQRREWTVLRWHGSSDVDVADKVRIPMRSSTCSGSKNPVVPIGPGWPGRSEATHGMGSCPLVSGSLRSLFYLPHRLPFQAYSV